MVAGTVTSAAVPGARAWDVVVGDRFIAAVAAPAPDSCLVALATAAADGGATIESLVGLVPLGGSHPVDSFAFVWWPGPDASEVTAVVRGDAVVDLTSPGGTRRFDSRGIRPWHLAEFGAVIGIRVTAAQAPLGRLGEATDPVPHARASLRASAVEWAAMALPQRPDASAADADTVLMPRGRPVAAGPITAPIPTPDADLVGRSPRPLGAGPIAGPSMATLPVDVDVDIAAIAGAAAETVPTPSPPAAPDAPRRRETPASSPPPPAPPAAPTPPQHAPPGSPMPPQHAPPASPMPPAAPDEPAMQAPAFRIGGGPVHPVTGPVLIGRRPLAPRIPGALGASPELIAVPSPRALVSGTHLELRLVGSRVVATDLRSTNGTIVRSPSGSRRMRSGESIVVGPGTSLDLGDGTIVEIIPAPAPPLE